MVYKWCVVPECKNTSIKSPNKLFVSVPTNNKRRKTWLQLARRDPNSILSHSNVFMCEDHFDMEKDTKNYMQYKMGFSQKILWTDEAVPTKFHCQEDRKRRLPDAGSSRKVFLKRQITDLVTECLQSQSPTETHAESLQKDDDMIQKVTEDPEPVADDEQAEMGNEASKVCRTCLAPGVKMCDVAAGGLQDTFEQVTGTELYTSDARPTQVCFWCSSQLQRFRAFWQMSGEAEAYMTTLIMQGLQITEREVSERHRLIKPKLDVQNNPLIAIHTQEDPDECVTVEVKIEVENEEEDKNRSDSETESETEIGTEVKMGTNMTERDTERENETEERQTDWQTEGEIKIEIDEMDIQEFDPFEAIEHATARDDTYYCLQCAEAFTSQCELLKHVQSHTEKKLKQDNTTRQNVKAKRAKRKVKPKVESLLEVLQ